MPSVSIASLIVIGKPCSGPITSPRARCSSAAAAVRRARSTSRVTTALIGPSRRSMRATYSSRSSRLDSCLFLIASARRTAGQVATASLMRGTLSVVPAVGEETEEQSRRAVRVAGGWVLVALVVLAFCINAGVRLPCRTVCGSDIARLYEDRGVDRAHAPFYDRDLEYPPVIGLVMYTAGYPFDASLRATFVLNALLLCALAVITTWMLWRRYGDVTVRWALAPPLFISGLTNWDLLAVAPATIGLLQWEAGQA